MFEEPLKKVTLREMIVEKILELIKEQKLVPGQKLPPERELALQLGVSRAAVREAMVVLSSLNIVEIRHGDGTFIKKLKGEELYALSDVFSMLIDKDLYLKIYEVRKSIEPVTTSLAVERATKKDLIKLRSCIDLMNKHIAEKNSRYLDYDIKFHLLIARATGNEIYVEVLKSLISLLQNCWRKLIWEEQLYSNARNYHEKIYQGFLKRDKEKAVEAMDKHLSLLDDFINRNREIISR